jgi:hypothetical protein
MSDAKHFRNAIRQYNSTLAFTSFTAKETNDNSLNRGLWVWKSGYTIYHRVRSLIPNAIRDAKYAQLYFYNPDEALNIRMQWNNKLNRDTMEYLQTMLRKNHQYTALFKHSLEVLQTTPSRDLGIHIVADPSTDSQRYNVPSADKIAVIVPGNGSQAVNPRNIILHSRGGDLQFIHDHHPTYAPLHYVLLFPFGTPGWTYGLPLLCNQDATANDTTQEQQHQKTISQVQFYSYHLHTQENEFPLILCGGHLLQQYICDV